MGDPDSASLEANMEDHITASLGPMVRLLRRLHSFEVSQQSLPEGLSTHKIKLLEEGLEVLYTYLKDAPEAEDPSCTPKWWIKEVRELSYDTEDYVDEVMDSGAGVRRSARLSTIFRIISKRKRRPQTAKDFSQLMSRVDDARERRKSFKLAPETIRPDSGQAGVSCLTPKLSLVLPVSAASISVHVDTGGGRSIVGVEEPMNKLVNLLAFDNAKEKQLKVIPIFGSAGVGKTTLARTLYHKFGGKFQCRAFLRVSRNPDMRRLLTSMLSQIKAPPRAHALSDAQDLIDTIIEHLGGKRYFIIIDDLWTASAWNIISRALPDSNWCSRIITTTQIEDVALACCGYQSEYIIKMGPLNDGESRKLFFNIVFGSEGEGGCPKDFEEVADGIIRKCGGLPLSIVNIASLLPSKSKLVMEQWEKVQRSLPSTLRTNPTSEGMKDVLILMYNNLPPHLKTCLLYLSMYPEGYTIRKDDLVKQWVAEGFVGDTEHVARGYLDELVGRGMIQPVDTNYNGEVLSCTVNHMVLDLIRYKSMEDNFIIAVDYFESTPGLPDKVRRLSVQFGGAKSAKIPESIVISQVRSLLFRGFFKCVPPIVDYRLLQVLILDIWADQDDASFDLTRICELFRLRYLKIECNVNINLPAKIWSLQYLETLEVDAGLSVVPSDIVHSQSLLHLCLPSQANLPAGIDHMISLRSLGYFNLGNNSRDNVLGLGKLINLWDLRLTCSTVPSDRLIRKMEHLGSILGELSKLKSLILDAGASSLSISCDGLNSVSPAPALLERLELPRLCIFPSLPMWFRDLNKLCILKIAVEELSKENIDILKGLHALAALSLYVRTAPTGGIVFGKEGFRALRYFKFRCTAPCLTFQKGAMPNVQRLKLRFDDNGLEQYDPVHAGFEHLLGLEEISAKIGSVDVDEYDSKSALWTEVFSELPSSPIFNMQLGDRIFNGDREKSSARNVEKHQTKETVQDVRVEVRSHEQYAIQAFAGEGTSKQAEADTGTPVASGSSLQTQILGEDECKATDTGSALEGPSSKHPNNPDNVNREFAEPIIHDDKETCSTRKEEKHFTPEIKDVTSLRTGATSEISSQPEAPLQTGTTSEITSLQPEAALQTSEERSDEQRGIEKKGPREDMIRQADSSTSMPSGYTAHLQDSGEEKSTTTHEAKQQTQKNQDEIVEQHGSQEKWAREIKENKLKAGSESSLYPKNPDKSTATQDEECQSLEKHGIQIKNREKVTRKQADSVLAFRALRRSTSYRSKKGGVKNCRLMDGMPFFGELVLRWLSEWIIFARHVTYPKLVDDLVFIEREMQLMNIIIEENKEDDLAEKWVLQLQELVYDIEDFIYNFFAAVDFIYIDSRMLRSVLLAHSRSEMKQLKGRIKSLRKWQHAAESRQRGHSTATTSRIRYDTPCYTPEKDLVGIAGPKEELLELLSSGYGTLRVISIVGCSGLGKTALARALYDDPEVAYKFDCKAWVVASEYNSAGDLIRNIDQICHRAARCFLVIDQLQLAEMWYGVEDVFRNYYNGSEIIVTTSIQSVATAAATFSSNSHLYNMRGLGYDESKKLFGRKVCAWAPALIDGSESILRKCDGLPLALVSTANFLRMHHRTGRIARFDSYPGCAPESFGDQMNRALVQCYNSLPDNGHRTCLLSLSMFPQGHQINRKSVIRRWIAEGLVTGDGARSGEEVAGARFDELIDRNLIEPVQIGSNSRVKRCRVHDAMVQFIVNKSISKNFVTLIRKHELVPNISPHRVRRLSVQGGTAVSQIRIDADIESIRSLMIFGCGCAHLDFRSFKLLRVLDLDGCSGLSKRVFDDICGCLFLKYLSLRGSDVDVVKIPKRIRRLHYLEMLDLRETLVKKLPMEVITLPRLVHLFGRFELPQELGDSKEKSKLQKLLSEKSRLQTLSGFVMEKNSNFESLVFHMRFLRKVKMWCEGIPLYSTSEREYGDFLQKLFTDSNALESLSIDVGNDRINFLHPPQAPCLLGSIKLRGMLLGLSNFVASVDTLSELQLSSTGLPFEELSLLQNLRCLLYLKLYEDQMESGYPIFQVQSGGFPSLERLCIEAPMIPQLDIQAGALAKLTSLHLLGPKYPEYSKWGVEGIEYLQRLNQVVLHDSINANGLKAWKYTAMQHKNRPKVTKQATNS